MAAPDPPKDYISLYASLDPTDASPALDRFAEDSGRTPADLMSFLANSGNSLPKGIIYLEAGRIRMVHRPFVYRADIVTPTEWDNITFTMRDDVGLGADVVLAIPAANTFHRTTTATRVPTVATMDAVILASPIDQLYLGPYADAAAPDTEEVTTRYSAVVPFNYASLALRHANTAPKVFWGYVVAPIIAAGHAADCRLMIDFVRVACTRAQADPEPPVVNGIGTFTVPHADLLLKERARACVIEDLPALSDASAGSIPQQMRIFRESITQGLDHLHQDRVAAAATSKAPKTVEQRWPWGKEALLRLTESDTIELLPEFWHNAAQATSSERTTVVAHYLETYARSPDGNGVAPSVPPALTEKLFKLDFAGHSADNITDGCFSLFNIPTLDSDAQERTADAINTYNLAHAGSAAPTIEIIATVIKSVPNIPTTSLQALAQRKGFSTWLDVILGRNHRLAALYRRYTKTMENLLPTVEAWLMENYKDKAILPSVYMRMMRYDQLMLSQFVAELVVTQIGGLAPVLPSFNEIPRWISMRSLVRELPHVPNRYLELVGSSGQQSAGGLPLASEDNHPGGTPRTSLPGPTGRNQALAGTTGDQGPPASRVTNPSPSTALVTRYSNGQKTVRELLQIADDASPRINMPYLGGYTSGKANQICLSYAVRGSCNSNCHRIASHRTLTAAEEATVATFLAATLH